MKRKNEYAHISHLFTTCYQQIRKVFTAAINCNIILVIKKDSPVKDVQEQFNDEFPFLKIEFLKTFSNSRALYKTKYALADDSFKRIPGFIDDGTLHVYSRQTVARLEDNFKKYFGVSAQVLRKSGDIWIETIATEDWTLEQQNKIGEQINSYKESQNFSIRQVS
jgi:hypothetical protein